MSNRTLNGQHRESSRDDRDSISQQEGIRGTRRLLSACTSGAAMALLLASGRVLFSTMPLPAEIMPVGDRQMEPSFL